MNIKLFERLIVTPNFLTLLLIILTSNAVNVNHDDYADNYMEFSTNESERGLFPNIFNLATNALIWADATCGEVHRETYCKLVEHVYNRAPQCDVCDSNNASRRHPIEFAIDGTRRWWQSPSLANGLEHEKVNITIDLRQEYQVAYIIVKSAIAPRPGAWVLEKSLDGVEYTPWQYFATSDSDCMRVFGVPASPVLRRFSADDEVICTSHYSKLDPLENGEIYTSLVNGRPSAEAASEALQEFTRARFVRLRLSSVRTLNAHLMIVNNRASRHRLDESVTRRYFYAIKDISIGGQCICHGHAETCPPDPVTGQFQCECRHNTCGQSCKMCCPLFNQLPWSQGTQLHPNICQACQCFNHANRCEYDGEIERLGLSVTPEGIFEGGGKCIDCKHNTGGINCERCKWTYYRPSGITHYREDACRPCDCDPVGSEHNNCVRDETSATNEERPGDCICKLGFGGRRCDVCAPGYRNYPLCEPCPCNQAGSLNFNSCEEEKCVCKANVEGEHCDKCKDGTIYLNVNHPLGCQQCFCFGLSTVCHEGIWAKKQIRENLDWSLTDYSLVSDIKPKTENGELLIYNVDDYKNDALHYWKAPTVFLGNQLKSYGGYLHYYVYFVPSSEGEATRIADIILQGNGLKLEYYSVQEIFPRENISMLVPMRESTNWFNAETKTLVDKTNFMRALADVTGLMVRAMYNREQIQSSIYGLSLDTAFDASDLHISDGAERKSVPTGSPIQNIEICECPGNYTGSSCEQCINGFRRVGNQLYGGKCEKCACEGHTEKCDLNTGQCLECEHNTTGFRCQHCLPGYYGNPSLGGEQGQCRACACPTIDNNYSPHCTLTQLVVDGIAASSEDEYVCTACEQSYDGNKCEICADGYFGDPLALNGSCIQCDCNGNTDALAIGSCDRTSGICLKCIFNTAGDHCEHCKENHWGSASEKTCKACNCHSKGSKFEYCDNSTGLCECRDNYVGTQCDSCKDGHGDTENMCPPCSCNVTGSFGSECDPISGQCVCKTGLFGKQCDMCRAGYFNFTELGCQFCHCDAYGAVDDGKCENVTGKCACRDNVAGNMCEICVDGYFNITSGKGCQECGCDSKGSIDNRCDIYTGQCTCKTGVTGHKCENCAPNHFGMSDEGCQECRVCPAPGHVCNPESGECVCPANTVGDMCENCTTNAWNYDPLKGCTLCDCSDVGALGPDCSPINGQCNCKSGYIGIKCDRCTHGYFNFPECEPCNCGLAGVDSKTCSSDGSCLCDDNGQCSCKKNVDGLKCDICAVSSFSLDESNPLGCTRCFCFNVTNLCIQSTFVWQQIYAEDREVVFDEPWQYYNRKHNINILRENPKEYNSYLTDVTPVYWPTPKSFQGDKTSSYNGYIRFKIQNSDSQRGIDDRIPDAQYFRYFPQVILIGNHRIILEHIPGDISDSGRYKVKLHEVHWRSRFTPEIPVTRKKMMVALQNVQGIYIRATYNYPARGDRIAIKEASFDIAVEGDTGESEAKAIGVEVCDCPRGYTGSSCQNPAEEYCRKRRPDYLNSEDDLTLVGWPDPCSCNGHSTTCDPETCRCLECQQNTNGDYCQYCKAGYFEDATKAGLNGCTKCACPLLNNSFSPTCIASDSERGYHCDNCRLGYTGIYCGTCLTDYYGNPNIEGGFCAECNCNPYGSKHYTCDLLTGQCECHEGVAGRDCSLCHERHAFMNGECLSCDRGCTMELMTIVDQIKNDLSLQNFSNIRPIPWSRINRIRNRTKGVSNVLNSIKTNDRDAESLMSGMGMVKKPLMEVNKVIDQAKFLQERSNRSINKTEEIIKRATSLESDVENHHRRVHSLVLQFLQYVSFDGVGRPTDSVTDVMVLEAQSYLNGTRERGQYIDKRFNRGVVEFDEAAELLKKITARKLNDTIFESLKERLDTFWRWIDDYRLTIWDVAHQNTLTAKRVAKVVSRRIDRFSDVASNVSEVLLTATDEVGAAENFVLSTKNEKMQSILDDYKILNDSLIPAINETMEKCQTEADKYAQLLGEYRQEYIRGRSDHVSNLENEALRLQNSFVDTKVAAKNPLRASNAYKEIVDALQNATFATQAANKAAEDAYTEADPSSETSMVNLALQSRNRSLELKAGSEMSLNEIKNERSDYSVRLQRANKTIFDRKLKKSVIVEQYQTFDDQHDRMTGLVNVARDSDDRAKNVSRKANEINSEVERIGDNALNLKNLAGESIRETIKNVRDANVGVMTAMGNVLEVSKQSEGDADRIINLGNKIFLLKEKIKEAREQASKIRISLRSNDDGTCRRSFISPMYPNPANKISIKYRPFFNVPDSLLFLTRTKAKRTQPTEYIAMELRDRRIVAHWDIGSGPRKATNTHSINFIAPGDRTAWYHITIQRVGNSMTLTVAQRQTVMGEGVRALEEPTSATVEKLSDDEDMIFNSVPGETRIYFGIDAHLARELGLATNKLFGTVGEFVVDDESLPLWLFSHSNQACQGDFAAPLTASNGHMLRNGFAQVRLHTVERPSGTLITIVFSAYSPDGLLYFRGDSVSAQFINIELRDGRVVFKVNLGDGSYASVQSKLSSYSDGHVHTVRCIRNNDEIHLQVDSENDRNSQSIPGKGGALNLSENDHFIAGVPSDFMKAPFDSFDVQWYGFFGCIQSVKPSHVTELDLDHPIRSQRKLQGCSYQKGRLEPSDRVVGFEKPGFLITQGVGFSDSSSLAFTIRSRSSNATLLFQSSKLATYRRRERQTALTDNQGYVAFYLYRGFLIVHLGSDASQKSKALTLRSEITYNDGQLHSILLFRRETLVKLRVDDRNIATGTLKDVGTIGDSSIQMFIGGFPDKIKPSSKEMPMVDPLIGCVSHIFCDYEQVPIIPEAHSAIIGSCPVGIGHGSPVTVFAADEPSSDEQVFDRRASKISLDVVDPTLSAFEKSLVAQAQTVSDQARILPTDVASADLRKSDSPLSKFEALKAVIFLNEGTDNQCESLVKVSSDGHGSAQFGLSESSHSRLNFVKRFPNVSEFGISFSFRTRELNGMLWAWANYKSFARFIFLYLYNGVLKVEIQGHRMPKFFTYSSPPLNNDKWHHVVMIKSNRDISIKVDSFDVQMMEEASNPKLTKKRMYVGGLLSRYRKQISLAIPNFIGCVRDFIVDNELQNLLVSSRDAIPCSTSSHTVYVHDGGYLHFGPMNTFNKRDDVQMKVQFRAVSKNGLLFGLLTNNDQLKSKLIFHINAGFVKFYLYQMESQLNFTFTINVCDGKWHNISLRLTNFNISLSLDLEFHSQNLSTEIDSDAMDLLKSLPIFLGGVPASSMNKADLQSFVGCFRNYRLLGKSVAFDRAKKAVKILHESCPFLS